ncbi:inositol 2-dehydrogenase [Oceanobacillus zhaokaii]|uniref:Inositol 2-dehydrogenase n=1 Tax=Oceanobacillus zhaokaii TaxID=2052660 RepID=A0A345PKF7_9BACI|nr:inositol 2-dehydrogenase [Oceanobacillus zhaokaii]AXI10487.1 inositol 2-dehydrogenase [Oceanobacillus zhaokaii]
MKEIRVGIIGLGRMGRIHARNIAENVPSATLYAACHYNEEELERARKDLGVKETFKNYEDMISSPNIDAVVIVSPSSLHTKHIRLAMEKGLHVFCEKPIGLDVEDIKQTIEVINAHPNQAFQLGFMRRYDESYQYAKKMVDEGAIGELTLIRCYGIDPGSELESFVKFAADGKSGGLFADLSIHDIDLVRWISGMEVKHVWAIGKNAAYPVLDDLGELETGAAMMQLEDKTMALLVSGRNAAHGYHVETELIGTKGMLRVAQEPEKNLVTVFNEQGVTRPTFQTFPERFREAFLREMREFILCIKAGREPEVTAYDGLQSTIVAEACQKSIDTEQLINLN